MFSNLTPKVQTRIGYFIALGTMGPLIVWALFTRHEVEGVKSSLINLTLPPGSTGSADNDGSGEIWSPHPGLDEHQIKDFLRSHLPINEPLDGLPYCGEDTSRSLGIVGPAETKWSWASAERKVVVGTLHTTGHPIAITVRKRDKAGGCD